MWSIESTRATSSDEGAADSNLLLSTPLPDTGTLWVEIGVSSILPDPGTSARISVGAWVEADNATVTPQDGHRCDVTRLAAVDDLALVERSGGGETQPSSVPAVQSLSGFVRIQGLRGPGSFQCFEPLSASTTLAAGTAFTNNRLVGLHTRYASARFEYVIVYHQPP
jgi:hypothetical protein